MDNLNDRIEFLTELFDKNVTPEEREALLAMTPTEIAILGNQLIILKTLQELTETVDLIQRRQPRFKKD